MTPATRDLGPGDALLLVDPQVDFCPGGALPIEGGHEVMPILNRWIDAAAHAGVPVFISRDWHPESHLSFQAQGGPWPPHCVQDTPGADFHPQLQLPPDAVKVTKGVRFDQDQNSAFDQTGLAAEFKRRNIARVWLGGLAQDVCVAATALDARKEGFDVRLIEDGTRPVTPEGGQQALRRMKEAGVRIASTS
jgi:nicotinamidase/pyrazinamidase